MCFLILQWCVAEVAAVCLCCIHVLFLLRSACHLAYHVKKPCYKRCVFSSPCPFYCLRFLGVLYSAPSD
jgi:hypothetical protein